MNPPALVAGAANLDRMMYVQRIPEPGETVLASRYEEHAGGKGANQAAACALWGQSTYFVGRVGRDGAGTVLGDALRRAGVATDYLIQGFSPSGLALDFIDAKGQYQAGVLAGANGDLRPADVPDVASLWSSLGLAVLQLECPLDFIEAAGQRARQHGVPVLLNAAPAVSFPDAWWEWISILVVNELEAEALSGVPVDDRDAAWHALDRLSRRCPTVMITLGEKGLVLDADGKRLTLDALPVDPVSTLGAGDAFVGVFAAEYCRGTDIAVCARVASVAAAASVCSEGAQTSYLRSTELLRHPKLGPALQQILDDAGVC